MKYFLLLISILSVFCCKNRVDSIISTYKSDTLPTNAARTPTFIDKEDNDEHLGFINNCENFRSWTGSLQNTRFQKTTFAFGACYGEPESYDAVFIPINIELTKSKRDSLSILFNHAKITNDFSEFKILVFVIPMLDPELQGDVHKDYTTYPTQIRIYKKNNNNWQLLASKKVKNYKEYANLQEYYVNEVMMELEK